MFAISSLDEFLVLVLLLLLPSLLENVVYVKKQLPSIFLHNLLQNNSIGTLYTWNVAYRLLHYINIVYSKVLQALSVILTNSVTCQNK